jgi:alpha-aminoadipic semialdehyde synthase
MGVTVGIRREDKNEWERRVPLIPSDLKDLAAAGDVDFIVQPSPIRVFSDDEYRDAGVVVDENLDPASVVLAVKEIPSELLKPGRAYLFFSHTIKGQPYNMPLLRRLLDQDCTLIDYERIADEQNRRLIFFSIHAGYAGMIETLVALAARLAGHGIATPLDEIKHAYEYDSLIDAQNHIKQVRHRLEVEGFGALDRPLVIGVAGYGNVAKGCRAILDCLPCTWTSVEDLPEAAAANGPGLLTVEFREEHMVEPRSDDAHFVLQDYYQRPENYRGTFERHLPFLDCLVNTIYWEEKYPRLVTKKWAAARGNDLRLKVIGDISCDIDGSIEMTAKATMPDEPCYVWDPATGEVVDGVDGPGIVIMAVDNLPCELPRESSEHFSSVLRDMVPALAQADFSEGFEGLHLPSHLKKAIVTHRGSLAPDYRYLEEALAKAGC